MNNNTCFIRLGCKLLLAEEEHPLTTTTRLLEEVMSWTAVLLTLTVGNCGLMAAIHYERFGGDWQKRGLINRMSTQNNYCTMAFANTFGVFWILVYFKINRQVFDSVMVTIQVLCQYGV